MKKPKIGDLVRDRTTGFTGVVTGITKFGKYEWIKVRTSTEQWVDAGFVDVVIELLSIQTVSVNKQQKGNMQKTVNLGDLVKDRVTGLQGIAAVRSEYLAGNSRIGIQAQAFDKGVPVELFWVDSELVDLVTAGAVAIG